MRIKIKDIQTMAFALTNIVESEGRDYGEGEALEIAERVIIATTNEYEKGYQKALRDVLNGKINIQSEGETVEAIDINTVIGLGLAHRENEMNLEREILI